ncbi:MAG: TerC family protein [Bacteroidota bacterium]
MEQTILFPFSDYWSVYLGFIIFVFIVLAIDLGVFHREAHEVSFKEAAIWSGVWIALALLFNLGFYFYADWKFTTQPEYASLPGFVPEAAAKQSALEFLTGYIIEKSLSIDNIFVFVVVFTFFAIPAKYQHRILFYGILGALIFRTIFISLGTLLLQYHAVIIIFGVFLVLTGIKIIFSPEKEINPDKNPVIKLLKKVLPVTSKIGGQKFFLRQNGIFYATPLFICLVFVELTDIVFAVDSVPAIFAITKEPLIVFTSNIFAILGLRALYFLLAGVVYKFKFLKYGLGLVLIFVGLKMAWLNNAFGGKFPISWSLGIIALIISSSVIVSLIVTKEKKA